MSHSFQQLNNSAKKRKSKQNSGHTKLEDYTDDEQRSSVIQLGNLRMKSSKKDISQQSGEPFTIYADDTDY